MPYIRLRHATRYFISTTITKLHDRSRHLTRSPNYPNPTNPVKQNTQISREKRSQTTFGLRMHRIEPHVEGEPAAASTEVDQSVATNQSDLEEDIQSNDGPHVAMVLNSVMRASSTLLETTRGVVHSSSVSGAETGIELEPYGFRALTHQVGDQSRLREGISTAPTSLGTAMIAPTLHSRCSTPPGARKEKGETGKTSEHARHGYKTTTRHIDIFTRWFESFQKFWNKHISVRVPGRAARDHLAIERTFLAYHRTSMVFALLGTVVAQLQVLNHKPNTNPTFGYYVLGKPLAAALISFSIAFSIMGWWRWYTWQRNTIRGEVVVRGWELQTVGLIMMLFLLALFGVFLGLLVDKAFFTK